MIRLYLPADRAACSAVFESNFPHFFAEADRADYLAFLDDADAGEGIYFVLEQSGELQACGGVAQTESGGVLTYGMVRGNLRGSGLGSALTQFRLSWIRQHYPDIRQVRIDTSQHTATFYARFGFTEVGRVKDGFGVGLDEVKMVAECFNV